MKLTGIQLMLIASLALPGATLWADEAKDTTLGEAVKHPEVTYDRHRAKSNSENAVIYEQKMKETKAQLEQAQRDLAASSNQGPEIREQAEKRVRALQKEYNKLAKKLEQDKRDVRDARQELNKDLNEERQEAIQEQKEKEQQQR